MAALLTYERTEEAEMPHFSVGMNPFHPRRVSFSNRSFYTIALLLEKGRLYYADKWVEIDRPALIFASPLMPYAWEVTSKERGTGFFCLFNDAFLRPDEKNETLAEAPFLNAQREPLLFLNYENLQTFKALFQKMHEEYLSDYTLKMDILRSYLHLLVHEVNKIQSTEVVETHHSAAQRIVELFLNMLDSQFPIDTQLHTVNLTTPSQYADRLCIHVNHLNRVVKQVTGKTTSDIIASRIINEAMKLLEHSTQSIGEIAFALGFEEPSSFSKFVKKHTGKPPQQWRADKMV